MRLYPHIRIYLKAPTAEQSRRIEIAISSEPRPQGTKNMCPFRSKQESRVLNSSYRNIEGETKSVSLVRRYNRKMSETRTGDHPFFHPSPSIVPCAPPGGMGEANSAINVLTANDNLKDAAYIFSTGVTYVSPRSRTSSLFCQCNTFHVV